MVGAGRTAAILIAFSTALAPLAAQAAPAVELYYERVLMRQAGGRCGLFGADILNSLDAAAVQARGAALRAGTSDAAVGGAYGRAMAKAASLDCRSSDLGVAAGRVRSAFAGYKRTAHMIFPGEAMAWSADRTAYRSTAWRLVERVKAGQASTAFGVAGRGEETALLAAVTLPDGEVPYAARLVYRDRARAPQPWVGAPHDRPLPPRSASKALLAEDSAPCDPQLSPATDEKARVFRFPVGAVEEIAALDPRERIAVEFLLPGDRVIAARFEVGDFAAGRAFLRLGPF